MTIVVTRPQQTAAARVLAQAGRVAVLVADSPQDVELAMQLRYRVFAQELGASIDSKAGLDADTLDAWCRHLIAVDRDTGDVVGTYRILMPEQARYAGEIYADREFDLRRLDPIRHDLVELGRACIDPGYRKGVVLMLLWRAMRSFVETYGHQHVIGCCSIPMNDGGAFAARLYRQLEPMHLAPLQWRVVPRSRLDLDRLAPTVHVSPDLPPLEVPALLKGYLKAGARLLGEPHVDPEFGCADFPILLEVGSLNPRLVERLSQGSSVS